MKIKVGIKFTESVLAGSPSDPDVYKTYIASNTTPEKKEEEAAAVEQEKPVETGFSVFPRTDGVPHFWDYHVRGFLKEAASAVTGKELSAYKSKIDKWVFVAERRLYFERSGQTLQKAEGTGDRAVNPNPARINEPEGTLSRIVRAMTMQGPRTSVKKSECMNPGASLHFTLEVLPLGEPEISADMIKSWFEYGRYTGMGEWRTGSNGRFELTEFDVIEPATRAPREPKAKKETAKAAA